MWVWVGSTLSSCTPHHHPTPPPPHTVPPPPISRPLHPLPKVLFILPSRYFCAIGLPPLLCLGWRVPPVFALHSQATLLACVGCGDVCQWDSHPLWCRAPADLARPPHPPVEPVTCTSHLELAPLRSPLLRGSPLVSFPPRTDMLKFCGYSSGVGWKEYLISVRIIRSTPLAFLHATSHGTPLFHPTPPTRLSSGASCIQRLDARTARVAPHFAPRCVLHRCGSREIHCVWYMTCTALALPPPTHSPIMIHPQVHLRIPCYDFSFL